MPRGCISLPVTFGASENFHTKSVLFDIMEVNLPFNAIQGRPALYQFMTVAHYRYLVLKMLSPNGVLKVRGDRDADISAPEKLQALVAARETIVGPRAQDPAPPSSHQRGSSPTSRVQPSGNEDVPEKTVQIGTALLRPPASRAIWTTNRNSRSSPSSGLILTCLPSNRHRCPGSPWR
jgi:hypothetical protein